MSHGSLLEQETKQNAQSMPRTLLIVDDDDDIRTLVAEQLSGAGFVTLSASDGVEMFELLNRHSVDLIVLDLNLPGEDGISLCRRVGQSRKIPIIMLTARGEPIDRVIGLEVGADDYLAKPFEPRELLARIRSVLRRSGTASDPVDIMHARRAHFRGWSLDFQNRCLTDRNGRVVMLSGNEFSLLKFLVENANDVLSRDQLLTLASPEDASDLSRQRLADIQIFRLRQKLHRDGEQSPLIVTVRNSGYVLAAAVKFE